MRFYTSDELFKLGYRPLEKMQRRRKLLACLKRYIGGENH
jgi:hypothetical protein